MRIKRIITNALLTLSLALAGGAAASLPAYAAGDGAACPSNPNDAKTQVLHGLGQTGSNCSDSQVNSTIQTVVTILSLVVGIASVIVILIAGFKYIVSTGDQNKVSGAKSTLLYALIGLAVAALTQLLIHFVLFNTNKT
jgi:hypothetical protein